MSKYRIELIAVFLITTLALTALSAGISQVEFREGKFLDSDSISELKSLLLEFRIYEDLIFTFILISALILFTWSFFSKKKLVEAPRSKGRLALIIQIVLWVIAILVLRNQYLKRKIILTPLEIPSSVGLTEEQNISTVSSNIPEWYAFLCGIGIIVTIGIIMWLLYRRRRRPEETLKLLAREAQTEIENLHAGADLHNVILRCYYQMTRILHEQKGIRRKQAMTPREFENSLYELGLPREPVKQLTKLFEEVRYGSKELGDKAELRAVNCLDAIARAVESTA